MLEEFYESSVPLAQPRLYPGIENPEMMGFCFKGSLAALVPEQESERQYGNTGKTYFRLKEGEGMLVLVSLDRPGESLNADEAAVGL